MNPAAIVAFLDGIAAAESELHSVMILRHGKVIAEGWWAPYTADRRHLLYSLSKSFTSTAIGMAIDEGLLSLEDRVVSFFPEKTPTDAGENLLAMRVRDLLSMSTGQVEADRPEMSREPGRDWVSEFLAQATPNVPGTKFDYSTMATYMCSAILYKVTGIDLLDYLEPRLFEPLGITEATWQRCPSGLSVGGTGLSLNTESIAKFGQLYLQRGFWSGTRLVSERWIDLATSKQIDNGDDPDSDWNQGYGFQFWRCRYGAYRGDGAFGQYCIVMEEQQMVIAMTGSVSDMQTVMTEVWKHILPGVDSGAAASEEAELSERLRSLELPGPTRVQGILGDQRTGKYTADSADAPINSWELSFEPQATCLRVSATTGTAEYSAGIDDWLTTPAQQPSGPVLSGKGGWRTPDKFVAEFHDLESPMAITITLDFEAQAQGVETLSTTTEFRGRFGPANGPSFTGRRA